MTFLPGLALAERFFREAVRPIVDHVAPSLRYDAALVGPGSEVLGFDTPTSADHHWGPRVLLFVDPAEHARIAPLLDHALAVGLPPSFAGVPTSFGPPDAVGVRLLEPRTSGPVAHRVEVTTVEAFCSEQLGLVPPAPSDVGEWLAVPGQRLLGVTAGAVFHDGLAALSQVRARLAFYPDALWIYLMSAEWLRLGEEEAFVARAGDVGDERGSAVIAARQVRRLMRLTLTQNRQYAPYSKWLGSAFARLPAAVALGPALDEVLGATSWRVREAALAEAYRLVAGGHNALRLTTALPTEVSPFYARPYRVIHAARFAEALRERLGRGDLPMSDDVLALPPAMGSIDDLLDGAELGDDLEMARRIVRAAMKSEGRL